MATNKTVAQTNRESFSQTKSKPLRELVDNRPESIMQRQLNALANDHIQLYSLQKGANRSQSPESSSVNRDTDGSIFTSQNPIKAKGADVIQRNGHPLENDTNEVKVDLMKWLKTFDSEGSIRNLILEDTLAAQIAVDLYKKGRKTGEADMMLLKSMLATIELHNSGATMSLTGMAKEKDRREITDEENKLLDIAMAPYLKKEWLVEQYKLDKPEVRAIEAYSLPQKGDEKSRYFMGKSDEWNPFKDGWAALKSALSKLPSLGQLGLELTSYRAPRTKIESDTFSKMPPESNLYLGAKEMDMGQRHYTSTALSYNSHWGRTEEVGGMVAVTGTSGVFINPFGEQGFVDGGEILYPPEIMTKYEGMNPEGYQGKESTVPVFHIKEVNKKEGGQMVLEDKDFELLEKKDPGLDSAKRQLITTMEEIVSVHGIDVLSEARSSTGITTDMMYLTIDELVTLEKELDYKVKIKEILDLF